MKDSEKEALFEEAEATAVQYFKEKFDMDVVITKHKLLPEMALSQIAMEGYVVNHEEQRFDISYDYNTKKALDFVMSQELKKAIIAKGYDPFNEEM
ncbi:hypothetical protein OIN60_02890 [Paenibacillus sp. P96]|uniref:Uncharacterized protein n=1 Tax=Paenibacillus zeirhizosphaerae TaxID=2987519 RepID=A0ABT9FLX0_9BACL|nr:hypothetical protein [Paenibacillus sp. P96]MDP4095736.1 hypothetical protein [Paenibacillus sp. P96]